MDQKQNSEEASGSKQTHGKGDTRRQRRQGDRGDQVAVCDHVCVDLCMLMCVCVCVCVSMYVCVCSSSSCYCCSSGSTPLGSALVRPLCQHVLSLMSATLRMVGVSPRVAFVASCRLLVASRADSGPGQKKKVEEVGVTQKQKSSRGLELQVDTPKRRQGDMRRQRATRRHADDIGECVCVCVCVCVFCVRVCVWCVCGVRV